MKQTPTLEQIHLAVNIYFGFKDCEIFKVSRKVKYVEPRQIFHYIAVTSTKYKLVDIANYKRKMNHSTVLSSVKRIQGYLEVDSTYKEKIDGVMALLACQSSEVYIKNWIKANSIDKDLATILAKFKADLEFNQHRLRF